MKEIESTIKIQKKVDQYIQGNLTYNEVDELWVTFLESPEWYEYFLTLINLHSLEEMEVRN